MTDVHALDELLERLRPRPNYEALRQARALNELTWTRRSRLHGTTTARDLDPYDHLIDLVDVIDHDGYVVRTDRVVRTVRVPIPRGATIAVVPGYGLRPAP